MAKIKKNPAPANHPSAADDTAVPPRERNGPPIIVGIGASAGGLEALQQFLEAMPPNSGMAFVHIQHLDPGHKSMMADLLKNATRMKVVEIEDGAAIEQNRVYINPPGKDVAIAGGKLHLVEPSAPVHGHLAIDFFFRSLAREQGDRAIGVVLSGTGSDGTLGVRAIKGAGGLTVAQDAASAKYDGMPRSAVGTQLVDFVVPPREMPRVLMEYVRHPYLVSPETVASTQSGQLEQIFALLREQTAHDFAHYKQNTIRRRIERRMAVHQMKRLEEYVRHLQRFPAEVDALFEDLLIGVTNFFRDPEAFHALADRIVPRLFENTAQNGQIRIWIPGCSTGEEAYSLAMLLGEHMDSARQTRKVCIFATDIDPGAIDVARTAIYPDSIAADVSPERLQRFFTKENGTYRIAKRIREMVIFAVQDVLKDPPFSRIDLVSCRNLLIYLEPELQKKLMQLFHAVLNPGGCLFLGASETVGEAVDLFAQVDKKWKIFDKRPVPTHPLVGVTALHQLNDGAGMFVKSTEQVVEPAHQPGLGEVMSRVLLESYAPACVVVDEHYDVLYLQGRTGRYLELAPGEPQWNLLKMARHELLRELRTALHKALKERTEIVREHVAYTDDSPSRYIRLRVKPFRGPRATSNLLLVAFEDMAPVAQGSGDGSPGEQATVDPRVADLERQLASMKESLQSTVEEVETSNEELRSTNEELQSANEELQSTNEELETSKEELQSVNEELTTVNNELQKKLEELSQANNDLTNLLNSTEIGTIFLDNELRIKRFTPAANKLVNLIPTDVGRPIADIVSQILDDSLADHAHEVLRSLVFQESEVRTKDGRRYLRRILPYRTVDNVIDGVVVTFVNITEMREAQRMVEAMLAYANNIVNAMRQPVALLNKQGRVVQANPAFYATFKVRREEAIGARFDDIGGGRLGGPDLRKLIDAVLAGGAALDGFELAEDLPGLGRRTLKVYAQRNEFGTKAIAGEEELTVLTIADATTSRE